MVSDQIKNAKLYYSLGERIKKGLQYLENTDFSSVETGKYEIDGKNIFVMISEYNSKSLNDAKPESHKNYIDIQFIIEGKEHMGYVPLNGQNESTPYNPEKDVAFYQCETSLIEYNAGVFAIFFPEDIHQPGVGISKSEPVKKAVVKIKV